MPALRIRFWGVRGSVPTPGPSTVLYGGNTSCVEVRAGNQILILDAGTGLRRLGQELLANFGDQPLDLTLLLTHTHWDHIQGLPFFAPVYQPRNRLRILGVEGARLGLENILSHQMDSHFFPVGLRDVPANLFVEEFDTMDFTLGAVRVQACRAQHPGICVGYRLTTDGRSVAFFPDNELPQPSPGKATGNRSDGTQTEKICEFLRGVDVLIMDTQYDCDEYRQHVGWGHGCVDEVVSLALAADVKQLFLFHHDPDHDDATVTKMTEHARQLVASRNGSLKVDAAREGLVVEV
jgi:phosphoribosyl 1,2-cyclic phosphodiesterase